MTDPKTVLPRRHRLYVGKDRHKFSSAHMTVFPDGSKERLHGHNYRVRVALELSEVPPLKDFLDFRTLKNALELLCEEWDERVLLPEQCPFLQIISQDKTEVDLRLCGKRYVFPTEDVVFLPVDNICVETLSVVLADRLRNALSPDLKKTSVTGIGVDISEADGQGCETLVQW